eukprot:8158356-Pyramimonas_sp.AAC.1
MEPSGDPWGPEDEKLLAAAAVVRPGMQGLVVVVSRRRLIFLRLPLEAPWRLDEDFSGLLWTFGPLGCFSVASWCLSSFVDPRGVVRLGGGHLGKSWNGTLADDDDGDDNDCCSDLPVRLTHSLNTELAM